MELFERFNILVFRLSPADKEWIAGQLSPIVQQFSKLKELFLATNAQILQLAEDVLTTQATSAQILDFVTKASAQNAIAIQEIKELLALRAGGSFSQADVDLMSASLLKLEANNANMGTVAATALPPLPDISAGGNPPASGGGTPVDQPPVEPPPPSLVP